MIDLKQLNLEIDEDGTALSKPLAVAWMQDDCAFVIEDYADDAAPNDYARAIAGFLACDQSTLDDAAPAVFDYYLDTRAQDADVPIISSPQQVWRHVSWGNEAELRRRENGDVRLSLECNCEWEQEHGLQLVFDAGGRICKVGPFDGHLSHADAYDDPALENIVYPRQRR